MTMHLQRWLKQKAWLLTLLISILALCIAQYAVCQTNHIYEETTRPMALYDLVNRNLQILDDKLSRVENWISEYENTGTNVAEWNANLEQARLLREDAEARIIEGNYAQADTLIQDAYELANTIPNPQMGTPWGAAIGGIIGGLLVIGVIVYLLWGRKQTG